MLKHEVINRKVVSFAQEILDNLSDVLITDSIRKQIGLTENNFC